jgi:hypothetical protein
LILQWPLSIATLAVAAALTVWQARQQPRSNALFDVAQERL